MSIDIIRVAGGIDVVRGTSGPQGPRGYERIGTSTSDFLVDSETILTYPADSSFSWTTKSRVLCSIGPISPATFHALKNGVVVGSCVVPGGSLTNALGYFTWTDPTVKPGDICTVTGPSPADSRLANTTAILTEEP